MPLRLLPTLDPRTRLRTRITLQAGLEYVSTTGFLTAYWWAGQVDPTVVLSFLFIAVCNNALFLGCIVSGVSKRFKDPSMTAIQMFASCGRDLFGMFAAPQLWYLFAFNLFIALPFGSLQFSKRMFATTWFFLCAGLGLMMMRLPPHAVSTLEDPRDRLLLWLFLSAALARLLLFNARISSLRSKLRNKLAELDAATQQLARLAARDERERIAGELHDTLLQGTYGLLLRVQSVLDRMPEGPARQTLVTALEQAEALVNEGRDRVAGLRASDPPLQDLGAALRRLTGEVFGTAPPLAVVDAEGGPDALDPQARQEIYWIAREAMLNVAQHAQAQRVLLALRCTRGQAHLVIDDDGVGLAPAVAQAGALRGHWGLVGMRERAGRIGGTLKVERRPGGGTRVCLVVPTAAADVPAAAKPSADVP